MEPDYSTMIIIFTPKITSLLHCLLTTQSGGYTSAINTVYLTIILQCIYETQVHDHARDHAGYFKLEPYYIYYWHRGNYQQNQMSIIILYLWKFMNTFMPAFHATQCILTYYNFYDVRMACQYSCSCWWSCIWHAGVCRIPVGRGTPI